MGALTETEIFDCLKDNLRSAANDCDLIARFPQSGPQFDRMRKALKLVEGACRQAAYWRQDARWLPMAFKIEEAHQIARHWLHRPSVKSKKLFLGLRDQLRHFLNQIERMQSMRTNRGGLILPPVAPMPFRQNRPVQVMMDGIPIIGAPKPAPALDLAP